MYGKGKDSMDKKYTMICKEVYAYSSYSSCTTPHDLSVANLLLSSSHLDKEASLLVFQWCINKRRAAMKLRCTMRPKAGAILLTTLLHCSATCVFKWLRCV